MKIKFLSKSFLVLAASTLFSAALFIQCSDSSNESMQTPLDRVESSSLKSSSVHWSYDGQTGPEYWGDLDPAFELCSDGLSQSPIDISDDDLDEVEGAEIKFHYQTTPIVVSNNGHAIQVTPNSGSYVKVDNEQYELLQFHLHSPSEHTINGEYFPMEAHFVHRSAEGVLLVIGVFFEEGDNNYTYAPVFSNMPSNEGEGNLIKGSVNLRSFLPEEIETYRYSGSLTTPPCSEGVKWNVVTEENEISSTQLKAFQSIYNHNFRPTLPLNGRTVYEYED